MPENIKDLFMHFPHAGRIDWIGIRPARNVPVRVVEQVRIEANGGLVGDHYGGLSGKRHVTLMQAEHLPAIGSFLAGVSTPEAPTQAGTLPVDPARLRRNLVVSGLNLLALKGQRFRLGDDVILEYTGECYPCSKMETTLGAGGYNAMRGHGGITARVVQGGVINVGDTVVVLGQYSFGGVSTVS
jgi:MOSC domain-containing protein YiiM